MSTNAYHPVDHDPWCPAPDGLACLCGADPREAARPLPHSTSKKRKPAKNGGPPHGPPRPINAAEKSMVERGWRAGFAFGRHKRDAECPYEDGTRPWWLWVEGGKVGYRRGRQALAVVQASYREGLEQLERGAPKVW